MGKIVLFWMISPPVPAKIVFQQWSSFLDALATVTIACVLIVTFVTLLCYRRSSARKKVRTPGDLFGPYKPIHWLWLSLASGVVLFAYYGLRYSELFGGSTVDWLGNAGVIAVWAASWTLLVSYGFIGWAGFITPPKFRYRPRWFFYRKAGTR